MDKIRVLFVCVHNSARSQMAEALLNKHGHGLFEAESAGLEPGSLNPLAVRAMQKMGLDISQNDVNDVFQYLQEGRSYRFVITVCDESNSERCPLFPGNSKRLHWSFEDPSSLKGSEEDKLQKTIEIRKQIEQQVNDFVASVKADLDL